MASTSTLDDQDLLLALELYELSGMDTMVKAVPAATVESFEQALESRAVPQLLAELVPSELLSAVATAFNAADLNHSLVRSIASTMSEVQMEALIEWYQSPLGIKVIKSEREYSQLLHPEEFILFQASLMENPPAEDRLELVSRLDEALAVTDSAVDSMLNMQMAFSLSVMKASPDSEQLSDQVIVQQAESQRPALYSHYQLLSRESLLFTYQDFTSQELEELIATMELPAGRRYVQAVNEGLETGIFDASAILGDLIVQLYHYRQSAI